MGQIFAYTLEVGIVLIFLYLAYRLLLEREKQYAINRGVLLGIYAVSLLTPLCIHWFKVWRAASIIPTRFSELNGGIEIGELTGGVIPTEEAAWIRWLLWIYAAGAFLTLVWFMIGIVRLSVIVRRGEKRKMGEFTLVITHRQDLAPFSWRNYIVVGDERELTESGAIVTHELAHIIRLHRLDLLFAQLYTIFMWYNPVSWLMMDELKTIHEYEADEAVIRSGANIKEYQLLLIKKAVGGRLPSFANSLNHSKLHKRITMMYKSKSGKRGHLGGIALIPALAVGIAVVSIPAVASVLSQTSDATLLPASDYKVSEKIVEKETTGVKVISHVVVNKAQSAGQKADLAEPRSAIDAEAKEIHITTDGEKRFRIENDGRGISEKEINIIAKVNDAAESVPEVYVNVERKNPKPEVYTSVEKMAEFPGGFNALIDYLSKNVKYPEEAQKKNIQGRVIIRFIVSGLGEIKEAKVIKGVDKLLDEEALRVINSMPKWTPGEAGGKAVDSYFTLPVQFSLTDDGKKEEKK